jgi:TolB-like protein
MKEHWLFDTFSVQSLAMCAIKVQTIVADCLPLFVLVCLAVAGCSAHGPTQSPPSPIATTPAPISAAAKKPNPGFTMAAAQAVAPTTVAVWDFDNDAPADANQKVWRTALAIFMIADLGASQNLRVIDREHLAEVLREQRFSMTGLSDDTTRLRIGRIIGAKYFVFGTYTIVGDEAALTARMVDVETGQIVEADSVAGKPNDLPILSMQLAVKFLGPLDQVVADREAHSMASVSGPTPGAQRLFQQGLAHERQHEYSQAIDLYTRALTEYPHYSLALDHLEKASEASARQ